jgi:hypothetical protein
MLVAAIELAADSKQGIQQLTKIELFINLKSAKALGITVPLPAIADNR